MRVCNFGICELEGDPGSTKGTNQSLKNMNGKCPNFLYYYQPVSAFVVLISSCSTHKSMDHTNSPCSGGFRLMIAQAPMYMSI
jgi:hypothetical protein